MVATSFPRLMEGGRGVFATMDQLVPVVSSQSYRGTQVLDLSAVVKSPKSVISSRHVVTQQ